MYVNQIKFLPWSFQIGSLCVSRRKKRDVCFALNTTTMRTFREMVSLFFSSTESALWSTNIVTHFTIHSKPQTVFLIASAFAHWIFNFNSFFYSVRQFNLQPNQCIDKFSNFFNLSKFSFFRHNNTVIATTKLVSHSNLLNVLPINK